MRVGDFGLARDVYSHLYYRADKHSHIPVRWSAPEVLSDGLCTEQSDVVSIASCTFLLTPTSIIFFAIITVLQS